MGNILTDSGILINVKQGNKKSPLGKQHSNKCCRQAPLTGQAKISRQKFKKKQDLHILKRISPKTFMKYKEKNSIVTVEKPSQHQLNHMIKVIITISKRS